MLRPRRAAALLVSAALVLGGACGGGDGDGDASAADDEPVNDRTVELPFTLTLAGDVVAEVAKELPVRVMTVSTDTPQVSLSLLAVGPAEPIALPDGRAVRAAFDLTGWKGDGTYRIQTGSPRDRLAAAQAAGQQDAGTSDQSNVLVHRWATGDLTRPPDIFDKVVEPCSLDVSDDGLTGVLRCARVTDHEAKQGFSLEMRWGGKKK